MNGTARRVVWVGALSALLAATQARADGTWADCVRVGATLYQFIDAATVNLSRDIAVGEPHGPWLQSSNPLAWRCTPRTTQLNVAYQTGIQAYSPYTRLSQIAYDGDTYGVYATNNLNVGYIARWRYSIAGQPTEWTPLTDAAGVYKTPLLVSLSHGAATAYDVGIETQIKLVRRNEDTIPSGNSLFAFDPLYARPMQTSAGATFYSVNYRVTQVRAATVIVLKGGTCTTPDVTVNLPDVRASQFSGVGRTAARKDFELKFENCPLGFGGINYSFSPTTPVLDAANGVVALSGASTASGVGVQFMRSQNEPLQFGKAYQLGEYSPMVGGSYAIPMSAGLYQTGARVEPGTASSAITFRLNYR